MTSMKHDQLHLFPKKNQLKKVLFGGPHLHGRGPQNFSLRATFHSIWIRARGPQIYPSRAAVGPRAAVCRPLHYILLKYFKLNFLKFVVKLSSKQSNKLFNNLISISIETTANLFNFNLLFVLKFKSFTKLLALLFYQQSGLNRNN